MKNVNSFCDAACESSSFPVCLEKAWKSRTDPASVDTTLSSPSPTGSSLGTISGRSLPSTRWGV